MAGCSKRLSSKAAGESKPEAYPLGYVEDFDELRTMLGEKRVSARGGWAGEKRDFFSILQVLTALVMLLACCGLVDAHDRLGVGLWYLLPFCLLPV